MNNLFQGRHTADIPFYSIDLKFKVEELQKSAWITIRQIEISVEKKILHANYGYLKITDINNLLERNIQFSASPVISCAENILNMCSVILIYPSIP